MPALDDLLCSYREAAATQREKGTYFEWLIATNLAADPVQTGEYSQVWTWKHWAAKHGRNGKDIGIDLFAKLRKEAGYAAIQRKFFSPNPVKPRSVVGAKRRSKAIEVKYQSLSSPEPRWRWILPHAIAFDGFRWHTRAFCLTDECFKDFLLSRMLKIRGSRDSNTSAGDDSDWHSEVTLEVAPHPELSETQARVISLDYGMRGGKAKIKVRRALLYCSLRRPGLDTDPAVRRLQDQQIVLLNRDVVHLQDGGSAR